MEISKEDLQAIFDLAVNSMDFGSGFWDTEETDSARRIAVLLDVNPMEATPHTFKKRYRHDFEPMPGAIVKRCRWCGEGTDGFPHADREQ